MARIGSLRTRPADRRWLVVVALFVVTYGSSTPLAAYGVFLPVLAEEFGWSRGAISSALSLNLLLGGLAAFPVGAIADRRGPRLVLVLTVTVAGAAFALVSTVEALWQLYLYVGILGGVGMSSFYLLAAGSCRGRVSLRSDWRLYDSLRRRAARRPPVSWMLFLVATSQRLK